MKKIMSRAELLLYLLYRRGTVECDELVASIKSVNILINDYNRRFPNDKRKKLSIVIKNQSKFINSISSTYGVTVRIHSVRDRTKNKFFYSYQASILQQGDIEKVLVGRGIIPKSEGVSLGFLLFVFGVLLFSIFHFYG